MTGAVSRLGVAIGLALLASAVSPAPVSAEDKGKDYTFWDQWRLEFTGMFTYRYWTFRTYAHQLIHEAGEPELATFPDVSESLAEPAFELMLGYRRQTLLISYSPSLGLRRGKIDYESRQIDALIKLSTYDLRLDDEVPGVVPAVRYVAADADTSEFTQPESSVIDREPARVRRGERQLAIGGYVELPYEESYYGGKEPMTMFFGLGFSHTRVTTQQKDPFKLLEIETEPLIPGIVFLTHLPALQSDLINFEVDFDFDLFMSLVTEATATYVDEEFGFSEQITGSTDAFFGYLHMIGKMTLRWRLGTFGKIWMKAGTQMRILGFEYDSGDAVTDYEVWADEELADSAASHELQGTFQIGFTVKFGRPWSCFQSGGGADVCSDN